MSPGGLCALNNLCTYDLYSPVHNVLDACIFITWKSEKGLGPGIPVFFGPQKTREFQGPTPSHYSPRYGYARIQNIMHGAV
jgi:hypothetical protein